MEEAAKGVQSLVAALGSYARRTVVGVWFPGFIVFCELSWLAHRFSLLSNDPLHYLIEVLEATDSGVVNALIILLVLSASIILGYVGRDIGFAMSDLGMKYHLPPARTLNVILSQIRDVFGRSEVDSVISTYPVFKLCDGAAGGLRLPRMVDSYVREFCKKWLQVKEPRLNTEGMETEINMVIGLLVPIALSSVVLGSSVGGLLGLLLACIVLLAFVLMLYRVNWARDVETEQAITNFVFAHWAELWVSAVPAAPSAQGSGEDDSG
jgi:hypothetical protein